MKKIKPDGSKTIYVGGVYEVDVTSLITGDGTYSLRISDSVGGAG